MFQSLYKIIENLMSFYAFIIWKQYCMCHVRLNLSTLPRSLLFINSHLRYVVEYYVSLLLLLLWYCGIAVAIDVDLRNHSRCL